MCVIKGSESVPQPLCLRKMCHVRSQMLCRRVNDKVQDQSIHKGLLETWNVRRLDARTVIISRLVKITMFFYSLNDIQSWRPYVFSMSVHPLVRPITVNMTSQERLEGLSSDLTQRSDWTEGWSDYHLAKVTVAWGKHFYTHCVFLFFSPFFFYPSGRRSAPVWHRNVLGLLFRIPRGAQDRISHTVRYRSDGAHLGCQPWNCADGIDLLCCRV